MNDDYDYAGQAERLQVLGRHLSGMIALTQVAKTLAADADLHPKGHITDGIESARAELVDARDAVLEIRSDILAREKAKADAGEGAP